MRIKSLVIGYVFALALFLFAKRHPDPVQPPAGFRAVVDLTFPSARTVRNGESASASSTGSPNNAAYDSRHSKVSSHESFATRLDAPAILARGLWTVDQIPPERLIAPLVVLDVRDSVKGNPDYQVSVLDVARWERIHGEIPLGSVVMALTRSNGEDKNSVSDRAMHSAGYSPDAAKFLVEGRNAVALGIDSRNVDSGLLKDEPVYKYTLSRSAYVLENVADLDQAPVAAGIVVVAPPKLEGRTNAPVRILALAR